MKRQIITVMLALGLLASIHNQAQAQNGCGFGIGIGIGIGFSCKSSGHQQPQCQMPYGPMPCYPPMMPCYGMPMMPPCFGCGPSFILPGTIEPLDCDGAGQLPHPSERRDHKDDKRMPKDK